MRKTLRSLRLGDLARDKRSATGWKKMITQSRIQRGIEQAGRGKPIDHHEVVARFELQPK